MTMNADQFQQQLNQILKDPDPMEAYYKLSDLYCSAHDSQREAIRQKWDFKRSWRLPDQNTFACQIPGERTCEQRILASLIYNSIEDCRFDWRDNLVSLCQIYHSTIHAGMNPDVLFREVARLSSPETSETIIGFIERTDEDKSLEAFDLKEVTTEEGVRIELVEGWPTEEEMGQQMKGVDDEQYPDKAKRRWWKLW